MCEKMEKLVIESRPQDSNDGWEQQVNGNADRAEETRQKRIAMAEKREAVRLIEKRARRFMNAVAFALALIISGGVYLNYVDGFPVWIAASVAVGGIAILAFVIGWICGHRARC